MDIKFVIGAGLEFFLAWLCIFLAFLKPRYKYASPIIFLVGIFSVCAGVVLLIMGWQLYRL